MFRLEKVFQNDDSGFIFFTGFFKLIILFLTLYTSVILKNDTIYDLFNPEIFNNSEYFLYILLIIFFYFIFLYLLKNKKFYKKNFISFLKDDILSVIISNLVTFSIFFIFNLELKLNIYLIYLNIFIIITLLI